MIKPLIGELMRLRIQAQEDGGWCIEHKENRYSYLYLLRCLARSLTRGDIQKEMFGVEIPLDVGAQQSLAKHYHANFSRKDWLFEWMEKFDEMQVLRHQEILGLLEDYLEKFSKDRGLPADPFITDSVATYLSLAKYGTHFKDLATSNDDNIFRYIFVEEINSFVGLYLISDFIEQKFSLLNFRIYASDETGAFGFFEDEIRSAITYGQAHIENQINNDILNNRWREITGSLGDAEALFRMNQAKFLYFSNSSQPRIRDAIQECMNQVDKPHQVTPNVRHVCLTNMVYLEYMLDSVARNHGKKDFSLHRLGYLLNLTLKHKKEPSSLIDSYLRNVQDITTTKAILDTSKKLKEAILTATKKQSRHPNEKTQQLIEKKLSRTLEVLKERFDIDSWDAAQELCYADVIFDNIFHWLDEKNPSEPLGIVSRKKKSTFMTRKNKHLHLYKLLGIHTTLEAKGRGRKIEVFFEFQNSKQNFYVEIMQHIANSFGFITNYLVDQQRSFNGISLIKLLAVDMLLQFSRVCAVSSIAIHDDDESGLDFLLNRINWSLERSATALGAFGCEESQAYFYVLSSIVTDPIEDEIINTPRKVANSIQNGLKALIHGFDHQDYSHNPPRISTPALILSTPVINFDSLEYLDIASKEEW